MLSTCAPHPAPLWPPSLPEQTDEETTETMECPAGIVGRIIGRGGETIRALQSASQVRGRAGGRAGGVRGVCSAEPLGRSGSG